MAVAESLVLLIVLLSAGLTTTSYTHEPLRAVHQLMSEAAPVGTAVTVSDLGKDTGDGTKLREFIMHVHVFASAQL